jgi:predicted dehydrogenase
MLYDLPVEPVVVAVSGRDAAAVAAAAHAYDIPSHTTDWRELVARDDLDIIDVCTPPGTHAEISAAAALAGKAVLCEKPMAATWQQARHLAETVAQTGTRNAIGFNYRRLPAVALMHDMIANGAVGRPQMFRASWMSDEFLDPTIPFDWRFDVAMGGSTIADLGAHLIDMALWMVGDIDSAFARSATFTTHRTEGSGSREVTVDEASTVLLDFAGGARGTIDLARTAARRPCDMTVEVNGTSGTIVFDYARLNELQYGTVTDDASLYGLRTIRAEHVSHPYAAHWWPIGQGVGYGASFVNQVAELLREWPTGQWAPDFAHGAQVQAVCAAAEQSAATGSWVRISDITNH